MATKAIVFAFGLLVALGGVQHARAQNVPGHPAVNEVDQRLLNQQRRTDTGAAQGQIGGRGVAVDSAADARVGRQLSRDEARHGGHITRAEYRRLNRELNHNSRRIYRQRHGM